MEQSIPLSSPGIPSVGYVAVCISCSGEAGNIDFTVNFTFEGQGQSPQKQ